MRVRAEFLEVQDIDTLAQAFSCKVQCGGAAKGPVAL